MKRFLTCILSVVLVMGLMPSVANAEGEGALSTASGERLEASSSDASVQDAPSVSQAKPEAATGAIALPDEATRDRVYVEDYRSLDYTHYYGPADEARAQDGTVVESPIHTDDAAIIETASKDAEGKTLVFESGKTYTFGSYVRSYRQNGDIRLYRDQGIHINTSNMVIEGNGATIQWDPTQTFTGWKGFVLEGTKDQLIHDIVIRNLNFSCTNNSWLYVDPIGKTALRDYAMTQLIGLYCENVLIENCTFEAKPNPDPALYRKSCEEGFGVNCVWLRPASNVTVQNCTMRNVTKGSQESGGNLLISGYPDYYWQSLTDEQRAAYDAMDQLGQYEMIRDLGLKGRVENILVQNNVFEHACHDETIAMWSADVIKDVLIQNNTFNVHDGDAHVASNVIFTFGYDNHHDQLENVSFTHNDVYAETAAMLLKCGADMGGDLHVTDNNLHVKRVPRDKRRDRASDGIHYVYTERADADPGNGLIYAAAAKDYVDFSGNRMIYDSEGVGLTNLMGAKNVLCDHNSFVSNGTLSYLALLYAANAKAAAGHETAFTNNEFDINGPLNKSLLRGAFRFTDNVVRLNGTVNADSLFNIAGNFTSTTPRENVSYVLSGDVAITGNKVFAKTALPSGTPALRVFDASFDGHTVDFTDNEFWSTVEQAENAWPLALVQDVQGQVPTIDATGTQSNLFNQLNFYRTPQTSPSDGGYGVMLTDPKVLYGGREYAATSANRTRFSLDVVEYGGSDSDETGALYYERKGDSSTWSQSAGAGPLSFTFKRVTDEAQTFGHFRGVRVDGSDVDGSCYDAVAGSVVISLHPDYLGTLNPGTHELQAVFDDGYGPLVTFTVNASQDAGGNAGGSGGQGAGSNAGGRNDATGGSDGQGLAGNGELTGQHGTRGSGTSSTAQAASEGSRTTGADTSQGNQVAKGSAPASALPPTGDSLNVGVLLLPLSLGAAACVALIASRVMRRRRSG